ncbi:threonine aldolase family protein [Actinoallomurus rhizosphaericola]|uniref:threonine aldolase family protein n=1 Tax=Actinoallomurus rhizosphaericola TaxID=2952536 RepID=UPI00209344EB|nr:GntG family PLP-dependent aldolase [Actinoallomurus rhizosphaericola]MCO5995371.1 beta-eliminating lyase-related protein [Actinoallomurus rhizosphaericola]
MHVIDLRSDTRTRPDSRMRAAMARAEVGDDSFGDDPTVTELEERVADLLGAKAALFTAGGTMSNLLAVLTGAGAGGGSVVAGAQSHLLHHENDGARVLARARIHTVPDPHGELDEDAVTAALAEGARPSLLWLENTSNRYGGNALDEASLRRQAAPARNAGAAVHLDGARLANAAVALGRSPAELAAVADTVSFSLCKGLGAPAGSLLCGPAELIQEARYFRRMIGGTLHQAGVLAAAGLVALDRLPDLAEDHRRAAALRAALAGIAGVEPSAIPRPTNMALFRVPGVPAEKALERLAGAGVLGLPITADLVRLVVHREHSDTDIERAAERIAAVFPGGKR